MLSALLTAVLLACAPQDAPARGNVASGPRMLERVYVDEDGDGYGSLATGKTGAPLVSRAGDCDDTNPTISPAAIDRCNGVDDDCDGRLDPSCPACAGGAMAAVGGRGFADLDEALDASAPGDTVKLCPGEWTVHARIPHTLTLLGYAEHPSDTRLLGDGHHRLLETPSDALLELRRLTLLGGRASSGGAVYAAGDLLVHDCRFEGHRATDQGGALSVEGQLWLQRSVLVDNQAHTGGAVQAHRLAAEEVDFIANVAAHRGGGLHASAALTLRDATFEENLADIGGAVAISGGGDSEVLIERTTFLDDRAVWQGGDVALVDLDGATVTIADSSFWRGSAGYEGGCLYVEIDGETALWLEGVEMNQCDSVNPGGAVKLDGSGGWVSAGFLHSDFLDNSAAAGSAIATGSRLGAGEVWLHDTRLAGGIGTAVRVTAGIQLSSVSSDFSSAPDDNLPMDLRTASEEHRVGGEATFACDPTGRCASLTP